MSSNVQKCPVMPSEKKCPVKKRGPPPGGGGGGGGGGGQESF